MTERLHNDPAEVDRRTQYIKFDRDFQDSVFYRSLRIAPDLGGLMVREHVEGGLQLLGFHATTDRYARNVQTVLEPQTELAERPPDRRDLRHNAKGVGVMLGNTVESVVRPDAGSFAGRTVGLWMTQGLRDEQIRRLHSMEPEAWPAMAWGIARHARRLIYARLSGKGAAGAIEGIERRYDDAGVVTMDPAPTWILGQKAQGIKHPVTPVWWLYRLPGISLARVGVYGGRLSHGEVREGL